ncbi:MAG: hypothetical protein KDE14_00255 [Rhodobacteraceae bacterium]|nr:hypothetical protein [Paracoccaceae bacterium]
MIESAILWAFYVLAAATIGIAGFYLSKFGNIIADKTGLGGTVIGLVLLATVTSLPELFTGITAVTAADAPNIAVGGTIGSCIFNLLILMMLELVYPKASIYTRIAQGHILSAGFGVIIIGFATLRIVAGGSGPVFAIGYIGIETPILIALYILAMQVTTRYERAAAEAGTTETAAQWPDISLTQAVVGYTVASVFVGAAGISMPFIAERLAANMGWNNSFVGTSLVALSTSLPELTVVLAAARIGALDMAIANLLGSNLFDALILAIEDIFYTKGPLLAVVSQVHAATGVSAMIMSGAVITAVFTRPAGRPLRLVGWTGIFLLMMYVMNAYLIYIYGA